MSPSEEKRMSFWRRERRMGPSGRERVEGGAGAGSQSVLVAVRDLQFWKGEERQRRTGEGKHVP